MAGLRSLSLRYAACAAALATSVIIARAVHRRRSLALANSKAKEGVTSKIALTPVIVRQRSVAQRGWHKARVVLSAIRLAGVRPARIALLLAGSRGDYQGYAQLCKILVQRRLKVEAWCLGEANAEFMRSLGIDARAADVPVGDELFKRDPQICKAMETGDEVMYMKAISALFAQHSAGIAASAINFHDAFQPDVIVYHPMMMGVAKDLHDVSGLPVVLGALFPRTPSKHLAPLYYARTGDDSPGRPDRTEEEVHADNLALHRSMFEDFFSGAFGAPHQEARMQAGLPPLTPDDLWSLWFDPAQPTINGWSSVISPSLPDWPESVHVTGYWAMDVKDQVAKFQPSAELRAFLEAGEPPVYLGWGSMVAGTSEQISRFAVEAAMGAGVRAVVLGGWAALSLDSLPVGPLREYAAANVLFYAGSLAHEWLFPRCAAAVHHGGAGTVAAVLRCGIPNIVTPVFIDQFYWARRVQALRVGVGFSEPLRSIGAPALAAAIKECLTSPEIKATAKTLGKQLKDERPGAETAADVVAEVARQRMLALAAAARTEDLRPPTPAPLKSGHAIGKGASFGSHVCV